MEIFESNRRHVSNKGTIGLMNDYVSYSKFLGKMFFCCQNHVIKVYGNITNILCIHTKYLAFCDFLIHEFAYKLLKVMLKLYFKLFKMEMYEQK